MILRLQIKVNHVRIFKQQAFRHSQLIPQDLTYGIWLIVHPKTKVSENLIHNVVDEFVSSSEQVWRNLALLYLITNRSAVNGCRQNER